MMIKNLIPLKQELHSCDWAPEFRDTGSPLPWILGENYLLLFHYKVNDENLIFHTRFIIPSEGSEYYKLLFYCWAKKAKTKKTIKAGTQYILETDE